MIWFDIEGPGLYWGGDQGANAQFMQGLIDEANALGKCLPKESFVTEIGLSFGIYTSYSQWNPIMGDYSGGSAYPLWYADWGEYLSCFTD
jgi:hypothetical protein